MKRKVVLDRPKLASSIINETKDFSFILNQIKQKQLTNIPFYKKGWFITTVASFIGMISISVLYLN
jgi:hypothetical protein